MQRFSIVYPFQLLQSLSVIALIPLPVYLRGAGYNHKRAGILLLYDFLHLIGILLPDNAENNLLILLLKRPCARKVSDAGIKLN